MRLSSGVDEPPQSPHAGGCLINAQSHRWLRLLPCIELYCLF